METLPVTSALAGFAAIFLVLLSFPIANHRRKNQLSAGDGGDQKFNGLIRAQGNFIEYTPLGIIVIGLAEANGVAFAWVCGLAVALAVGRLLHAAGMIWSALPARALGAILTFGVLLLTGAILVFHSFAGPAH
jgi:uncharacterized membrane protein YecN with MAPEG domain